MAIGATQRLPTPQPNGSILSPVAGVYFDDAYNYISLLGSLAGGVQIGQAAATAGAGVRVGASRVILINKPTAPVDATGGLTATVTQVLEAGIFSATGTASLTLPTAQGATGLVQALPGAQVGDIIEVMLCCTHASQVMTLVAGTGSTVFGVASAAAGSGSRLWRGRITAVTAGSETITWY